MSSSGGMSVGVVTRPLHDLRVGNNLEVTGIIRLAEGFECFPKRCKTFNYQSGLYQKVEVTQAVTAT